MYYVANAKATPYYHSRIPRGGAGTRFLPATKAQPKEMLPVVDKPLIQYAVEEAYASGIRHMIFVTGRNKRAIEDHFDTAYELEAELEAAHKNELTKLVQSIKPDDMDCSYVRQARSLGLGHAVLCAERMVGNQPFAVLLADDLMVNNATADAAPVLAQMMALFAELGTSILAVQEVSPEKVNNYGIVASVSFEDRVRKVMQIVEKPPQHLAPSTLAVAGRYILTPAIFSHIRQQAASAQAAGLQGEIQLTDAISRMLKTEIVHAYEYVGKRFDCGSIEGFLEATVELALTHPSAGASFKQFLQGLKL